MAGFGDSLRAFFRWTGDWIYAFLIGFGRDTDCGDGEDGGEKRLSLQG